MRPDPSNVTFRPHALALPARIALTAASLGLACTGAPSEPVTPKPSTDARPNILLVTLDTTRADALSIYGNKRAATPRIAALAEQGTRFSRAFTVTPLTIPAHSSIFTGLYPPRHGVRDNGDFFLGPEAFTLAERLQGAGYQTFASVGAEVTSHHWGFNQGFDQYFDDMGQPTEAEANRWRVERRGDLVVNDALGWLGAHDAEPAPWFGWVHLFDAHHPYAAPSPYAEQYPDQPYLAEVAFLDAQVGRLIDDLQARGALDHTFVIVTADHGEGLGSHGEAMHGVLLYNATTRIPLVMRPPGGQSKAGFVHFAVSLVDLLPTALSVAGLPAPEGLDGQDLQRWVAPPDQQPIAVLERSVLIESLYGWRHYGWAPQRALVGRDVKVIDSTTPEMYTRDDVIELTDIAAQHPEEVSSAVRDLAARYATWSDVQTLSGTADQSGERMAQLEALGYMTSGTPTVGQGFGEGLPDPVKHLPALREMERARSALQRGDLPGAEAAARALIAAEPGLVEAKSLLAQILSRSGQTDAAMELLTTLDAAQPATGTKVAMASLLLQRGQPRRSLPLYAAALETDPYYAPAWTGYLHALFLSGEFQQLEAELNRAHSRIPDLQAAQTLGGVLHAARGKWGPAGTMLSAAQAREPYQPFLNLGLGMVAMSAGEAEAAEGHFTEEIALYPPAIPARKELVKLYAGQSRYAEQLEQLEPLVRFQPEDTLNHRARAQALFNLGRYPEAKAALKGCLDREPEDDACLLLLANTQGKLGETEAAKATFEKAKVAHAAKGPR